MPEPESRELVAGPLRIVVEHRRTSDDEGNTVRVFGVIGEQEKQVLRFDCFVNDPHYHYDPDGRNELHHMRDEGIDDPPEWTVRRLERNLVEMIRRAGYGALADRVDQTQVAQQLPSIQEAMLVPAV